MLRALRCRNHFHLCVFRRLISVQTWPHEPSSPSACKANTRAWSITLPIQPRLKICSQSPSKLSLGNSRGFSAATDGAVEEVGKRK